jgi:hypothetical protein
MVLIEIFKDLMPIAMKTWANSSRSVSWWEHLGRARLNQIKDKMDLEILISALETSSYLLKLLRKLLTVLLQET